MTLTYLIFLSLSTTLKMRNESVSELFVIVYCLHYKRIKMFYCEKTCFYFGANQFTFTFCCFKGNKNSHTFTVLQSSKRSQRSLLITF